MTTNRLTQLRPADLVAWRNRVRTSAPGGHGVLVGLIIADLADPDTAILRCDDLDIHRIVLGAHVHPVGLRRLLAMFVAMGLLVEVRPPGRGDWGSYALALPASSANAGYGKRNCRAMSQPAPKRRVARAPRRSTMEAWRDDETGAGRGRTRR